MRKKNSFKRFTKSLQKSSLDEHYSSLIEAVFFQEKVKFFDICYFLLYDIFNFFSSGPFYQEKIKFL